MGYFDNQTLWYELFHASVADDLPKWLRGTIADEAAFDSVMAILVDYCFLETQEAPSHRTAIFWSMHNCVHDWVVGALNKTVDPQLYWYAFGCIVKRSTPLAAENNFHTRHAPLAAHAARLTQDCFWHNDLICEFGEKQTADALKIGMFLEAQRQLCSAHRILHRVLMNAEKLWNLDPTITAILSINLVDMYTQQRKFKMAEEILQRAVDAAKVSPLFKNVRYFCMGQLGLLYRKQGKMRQAKELHQRVTFADLDASEFDERYFLGAVLGFGQMHIEEGNLKTAEAWFRFALDSCDRQVKAVRLSRTQRIVVDLGNIYYQQGRIEEAENMFRRALMRDGGKSPNEQLSTALAMSGVGSVYIQAGRFAEAQELLQTATGAFDSIYGPKHPQTLLLLHTLENPEKIKVQKEGRNVLKSIEQSET